MGGKSHLRLNTGERPIAHKYREGKMQRTLKRELKVLEIVERETIGTSEFWGWRGFSWKGCVPLLGRATLVAAVWGGSAHSASAFPCRPNVGIGCGHGRIVWQR